MLIYHDAAGKILHTINGFPDVPPAGGYIEVSDDTDVSELTALSVIDGVLTETDIEPYKRSAVNQVNSEMNQVRLLFISDIVGQEMIYTSKEEEARAYIAADPEPTDLTEYPFLAGEIGSTGATAYEVAQVYLNLSMQWRQVGSQLESLRIGTNTAIENATTKTGIEAIMTGFETQLGAFQ